jgi:hypothetical protein
VRRHLLGITLILWTGIAAAGRPLVTEDAGVLGAGECEIETFYARESASGAPTTRGGSAQFGCGIGLLTTQLALNAARSKAGDERVDRLAFVGKTGLRELKDDQAGIALAYELSSEKPSGGSFGREASAIRAVLTVPVEKWLFHANLGWLRSHPAHSNSTIWAVAAERTEVGPVDLAVESFGDDRDPAWFNFAVRWHVVPEQVFLDASYGFQTSSERPKLLTIGAKFAFSF